MRGKALLWTCLAATLLVSLTPVNVGFTTPETIISVDPDIMETNPLLEFTVAIYIMDAVDVVGWEFKLSWDLALTEFPPYVEEGDFLSSFGPTSGVFVYEDFGGGYIKVTCTLTEKGLSAEGEGTLAYVTFKVKDAGMSVLDLFDTKIWRWNEDIKDTELLPHETADGLFYTTAPTAYFDIWPKRYVFRSVSTEYWDWKYWFEIESYEPLTWAISPWDDLNTTDIKKIYVPGDVGKELTFDASAAYDPDNVVGADPTPEPLAEFAWDFGDGTPIEYGMVVNHTFSEYKFEAYKVTLTVTDDDDEQWKKTIDVRVWRDLLVVDIWPSIAWWDTVDTDVFHGQLNPYEAYPMMGIFVTVVNLGSMSEKFTTMLYADLDTTVIGDEFVLYGSGRERTLFPGMGSGFSFWYLWDIRAPGQGVNLGWAGAQMINPLVTDPGLYTLTADITLERADSDPANDDMQLGVYLHARAEPQDVVTFRSFKLEASPIHGNTITFTGKVKNMEPESGPTEGAWARLAFDVIAPDGTLRTFRTDAVWVENQEVSDWLSASWTGLTVDDVGTYYVMAYTEFGWKMGEDFFPFAGTEPYAFSFDILP